MEDTARLAHIEQNTPNSSIFKKMLLALVELLTNILKSPHDMELRKVKNSVIKNSLNVQGFLEYLNYIGFEQAGNELMYPMTRNLNDLRTSRVALQRKLHYMSDSSSKSLDEESDTDSNIDLHVLDLIPSNILTSRNQFILKLRQLFNDVLKYEDGKLQEFARQHIPIVTLQIKAIERMKEHQKGIKIGDIKGTDMNFDIALLIELLHWFKNSFFKWTNRPECKDCGGDTVHVSNTTMEVENETCRVEVYSCKSCDGVTNFPRHNCPRALLKSKRGRCGEWAACFTLLCRALNFDTRYIYDTTDHVWCEVFDYDSDRWVHVDPCEAKLDTPLLYEHGWGKKLDYVIAFSRDDLQDVTWRYSSHHRQLRERRRVCSELELIENMMIMRGHRQRQISEARRKYLAKRCVLELAQMLIERKPGDDENEGRISGDLLWRQHRGELGEDNRGHVFDFKEPARYCIDYVTSKDDYRLHRNSDKFDTIKNWSRGTFESNNVFRKEEKDWKMAYLARIEGAPEGSVSWKVVTTGDGLYLSALSISASAAAYENGVIKWSLQFDNEATVVMDLKATPTTVEKRFKSVIIKAELSGGRGDVSWQHAQLFRQALTDCEPTLSLKFTLDKN